MDAPTTYEELCSAIQERIGGLAAGQQRIAELLLTDPEGTAFRTIGESAKLANVHESSLVRFATAFGLKGYPALAALCREHLAREARLITRFRRAGQHSETGEFLSTVVEHEQQNLTRTFTRITAEQWDRCVQLLAETDRVHVMGLRKCLPVAQLTSYLLRLVRPGVHQIAPVTGALVDELRDLRQGEVFIAISIHRYTAETVRAFEEAKKRGLHTIALTDTAASPLARIADVTFQVDCEGVTLLRSVGSFIALVQALATSVALRNGTRSRDELLSDEQLLSDFSVYTG
ncbi:MurR/RpiR family transcriptional regulator [Saccharopolyspora sp. NPDC002686]|uniref:MurR/RpiR family transcriptional regulator n=1 Tax=Saccharopolyspora sp. NPDC002686 TaxID=3154541 RepID=UPI003327B698